MTEHKRPRKDLIPAHIKYPGIVVLFLAGTVTSQVFLVRAALSDGGAQVVDDYYDKAVNWDEERALRDRGTELGWTMHASLDGTPGAQGQQVVTLSFLDAQGLPITDLSGDVTVRRPSLADPLATRPLVVAPEEPGTYRIVAPMRQHGLYDLDVDVERSSSDVRVLERVRLDTEVR